MGSKHRVRDHWRGSAVVYPTSHNCVALVEICFESAIFVRLRFICGVGGLVEWSTAGEDGAD